MKIRLFTIPNMLTLANLICGALSIIVVLEEQNYSLALSLTILAAAFDFSDGFAARMLNQCSPIGKELDSLADIVSFGLAPAIILMSLAQNASHSFAAIAGAIGDYYHFIPLILLAFSALRLAKFNVDEEQCSEFIGLPTPAAALFCVSLAALQSKDLIHLSAEAIGLTSIVVASLLISPLRMFALKFKGFAWRGNQVRYSFILLSMALFATLKAMALPAIIALYILVSLSQNLLCSKKNN